MIVVLSTLTMNAQLSPYSEFTVFDGNHYWVEAGASYNKVITRHTNYKIGYRGGVGADIPIYYSSVSFLPALQFQCKGYTQEMTMDLSTVVTDVTAMYVEIPIDFSYNVPIGKKMGLQFCGGPYIAVGIAGNYTESSDNYISLYGQRTLEHKPFWNKKEESEYDILKKIDFGANVGIRYIFLRHAMVKLDADFGCIKINAKDGVPGFRGISFAASLAFRY